MTKTYHFKCSSYSELDEFGCKGNHTFELDHQCLPILAYMAIFRGGLTIDKKYLLKLKDEFEKFIDKELIKNQETQGESLSHFYSIDINAELMQIFLDEKFGRLK